MHRPRLTYANVMATIAVFIAPGGTSYAVVKINGSQIEERSIPASKIKKKSLTAAEVKSAAQANSIRQLVFSKTNRSKTRDAGGAPSTTATSGGIVKLSLGQSATLIQAGPFTVTLRCMKSVFTASTLSDSGVLRSVSGVEPDGPPAMAAPTRSSTETRWARGRTARTAYHATPRSAGPKPYFAVRQRL